MRTLAASILALCATPLLFAQDKPQEKPPEELEMKWTFQEGDKFDFKWGFSETRDRKPGRGDTTESHDKREVEAELSWKAEGVLLITLKKVVWSYGTQDYEVALMFVEGKKLEPKQTMKVDTKAPGYPGSKGDADRMVEYMLNLTDGEFTLDTKAEPGKTLFLWNGGNVRGSGLSLFDRIFTHPVLPSGPVRV